MYEVVAPWIPPSPRICVVGQSPGREEAARQRPFIGPAGQQLRGWLRTVGLDPDDDVMFTNVHDLYHPDDPVYKPTAKECKEGYARVREETASMPSLRAVLLVGAVASHMMFKGGMAEMHGRQGELDGLRVYEVYHPSFYLRQHSFKRRAEIETEVLAVLVEVVRGLDGSAPKLVLPEPVYVEGLVIA